MLKQEFIKCIKEMNKAKITYFSKKDNSLTTRIVAPLDIGPRKDGKGGYKDAGKEKFWFFDFTGTNLSHITHKNEEEIKTLIILNEKYTLDEIPIDNLENNEWFIPR